MPIPAQSKVVVIGAGQAGLSVSYYLQRFGLEAGVDFVVLDRGPGPGGAWQFRWEALKVGISHHINDLPGLDELGLSFETADRTIPAKFVVADYYQKYEQHYQLQVVRPADVESVVNRDLGLAVNFKTEAPEVREIFTEIVVNATGTWGSPFIPWYAGMDSFEGTHLHTTDYVSAEQLRGKKVVVVGGGTSAIGFLLELEDFASELTWVTRRAPDFLDATELDLEARAAAVALQDEAARAGKALPSIVSGTGIPRTRRIQAAIDRGFLTANPMFEAIETHGVKFADGTFKPADVILWATGFRPELRHLAPLKLREKAGGVTVGEGSSWKDSRIFFAGYGPQASTIGANRAGRRIARQVVTQLDEL